MTGSRAGSRSSSTRDPRGRLRPKKRFGQHFLSDRNILRRIVDAADLAPDDAVVEIGPGAGDLTDVIAGRAARVVAVEVDRDLLPGLRERFAGRAHVTIVEGDVLEFTPRDLLDAGGAAPPYAVIANLPYNVAAPVIRAFLEGDPKPRRMVVMVQAEVADAIVARPGEMSLLSVAVQAYAEPRLVMRVPPGAFRPPPAVQSAAVRLDVAPHPRVDAPLDAFFRVVRAGFGNPRKQLRNSLSFGLHVKQEVVEQVLLAAGVDPSLRPQVLALDDWAAITRAWLARPGQ